MPIQPENKIFPHVVPPTPDRVGNLKEDFDALFEWASDLSFSLTSLNRQIIDKYNTHVSGTHAHPGAWANMRISRPRFEVTTDGTDVVVPGSAVVPSRFVIDGELFEIYADLTCDLTGTGAGKLDEGAIAQDTPYYLYGVRDSGTVALMASDNPPVVADVLTGPTGYTKWTYLGSFATQSGAATVRKFKSVDGFYMSYAHIRTDTHTGTLTMTEFPQTNLPITAKIGFFDAYITSDGPNDFANISSYQGSNYAFQIRTYNVDDVYMMAPAPVMLTNQSIWLDVSDVDASVRLRLIGWQEDPTEYP